MLKVAGCKWCLWSLPNFTLIVCLIVFNNVRAQQLSSSPDSVLQTAAQMQNDSTKVLFLLNASKQLQSSNLKESLLYSLTADSVAAMLENKPLYRDAIRQTGVVYFYLGMLEEAADYLTRFLEVVAQDGSNIEKSTAYTNLGAVWIQLRKFRLAEECFMKALQLFPLSKDLKTADSMDIMFRATVFNNLGIVYKFLHEESKASNYFRQSIAAARSRPFAKQELARSLVNYGDFLLTQHDLQASGSLFSEALSIAQATGNELMEAATRLNLAQLFANKGDTISALYNARKSQAFGVKMNNLDLISSSANLLSEIFAGKGLADSAIFYSGIVRRYDSLILAGKTQETMFRGALRDEFADRFNEQNLKISKGRNSAYLLMIAGLVVLFSGGAFYLLQHKNNKAAANESLKAREIADNIKLENQLLTQKLAENSKQLVSSSMQELERQGKVQEAILKLSEIKIKNPEVSTGKIRSALDVLNSYKSTDSWEEFDARFRQVETAFYVNLTARFPNLTSGERRLCALLKLDMSTKEISTLTKQSIRSIEMARIRIRKKLNITHQEVTLAEFLATI